MKNRNTRLLGTNNKEYNVALALGGRGLGEGELNEKFQKNTPSSVLRTSSPSRGEGHNGFTLIELLVVVLIIGILAGVALPQYNKAVRKARLSEVATTFNSISKGIDMYLMENGYPDYVIFSGTNGTKLDIAQSCTTENTSNCHTKLGSWFYYCNDNPSCEIIFTSSTNADGTSGNKWLDEADWVWTNRYKEGVWTIDIQNVPNSVKPEICRWWANLYGKDNILVSGESTTMCNAYL